MKWLLLTVLTFSITIARAQETQVFIDVGAAQVKRSLLALPPLQYIGTQSTNKAHIEASALLYRVIANDLDVSNFFTMVKPDAYLEDPMKVGLRPAPGTPGGFNFKNWQTIGTEFLVRAAYQVVGNEITFETYVYHVPTTKLVLGKTYKSPITSARKLAHTFAGDLVKSLTGKKGMFNSRIVASRQNSKATVKEIHLLDWDGANDQAITQHDSIAISPAWSTKGDKIAYTAFAYHKAEKVRNADMFIYDIPSNKRFLVSYRKGINSGAAFIPGDTNLLLTLSQEGSPDIYNMTADGRTMTPITRGPNRSMNVEPAVSPDGKMVAFSSDRVGRPMIFTMNIDGTNTKRLTFAGKYNSTPAWSPDGKMLAFAALDNDHFDIFVMTAAGGGLKRLTDAKKPSGRGANNESPSWSPDGRHISFTSDRSGKNQIYIISPDGQNERRITNDNFNWDKPKWSPYLD